MNSCLHKKNSRLIHFILIFSKLTLWSSKHLSFLSLLKFHHILLSLLKFHHIQADIVFHQSSYLSLLPIPDHWFINSKVVLGITQLTPKKHKKLWHRLVAVLQCINKLLLTYVSHSHIKHLEHTCHPLLCSASCVRRAFLHTSHEKQVTFSGLLPSMISFQGPVSVAICLESIFQ